MSSGVGPLSLWYRLDHIRLSKVVAVFSLNRGFITVIYRRALPAKLLRSQNSPVIVCLPWRETSTWQTAPAWFSVLREPAALCSSAVWDRGHFSLQQILIGWPNAKAVFVSVAIYNFFQTPSWINAGSVTCRILQGCSLTPLTWPGPSSMENQAFFSTKRCRKMTSALSSSAQWRIELTL